MNDTPRLLGDYEIIKQIGQGALGAVYLAEHRFMKKPFALKVLPEDLCSDRAFIQRFEEEAGQLSSLEHPYIVKIHNVSYDQGVYFLVTDCVVDEAGENTNLSQYIQERGESLSEEEVYELLHQVADALDYAHNLKGNEKGIAHRGIKLSNILVGHSEQGVNLYLSDFGLSKVMGAGTFITRTYKMVAETLGVDLKKGSIELEKATPLHHSFLNSFQFLAPEQKRVIYDRPVDFQADTYAFGVLTYLLLMNAYPEGYFEMPLTRHPTFKMDWDSLVCKCLQVDPLKRPNMLVTALDEIAERGTKPQPEKVEMVQVKAASQEILVHSGAEAELKPVICSAQIERPVHDPDPASVFEVDSTVKHYVPEKDEVEDIEPIHTEMVIIQGETFTRGSNEENRDEMPRHQISIDSFAIDVHPVTNEQFVRFLDAMGGVKDSNHNDIIRLKDSRVYNARGKFSIESGYIKHPVVGVTWYGAVAYAKWIGKRLPTEAEWEITSLSDEEGTFYPTGKDVEKSQANFFSSDTTNVMSYPPNGRGIYDLAGNVYEWCQDWYGYNYYETSVQEPNNPKGPLQGVYRVLRGGCWKSLKEDLRCSKRHRNNPGAVNSTYGFRCATDVE